MKISFIQPFYHNIWEAIGIGYIASYIQSNYSEKLDLKFYQAYFDNDETIINGCTDSDIVAFSTTSASFKHGIILAEKIKTINKNCMTFFGGWHVTALKKLINNKFIDMICVGEGEKAFLKVLNGNKDKIVYGEPIQFKDLPWPDRELIKNNRTIDECERINGKRTVSFQAHRVCPLKCVFCSERIMTGIFSNKHNPVRERNILDLINEIVYVKSKYNINYFKFVDATFDTKAEYVIEFCKEKINNPFIRNLEWECMIHATFATEEMFYWLKQSKCYQIDIGCESGSNRILKDIGKGTTTNIIKRVFRWAVNNNIKRRAFFILGMPNETINDIKETEKLIDDINPDVVGFTILCPYPGCDLYDHEKMKNIDWSETDEYYNDFWQTKYFTNQELKQLQQYLNNKYKNKLCERQQK